MSLSEVTPHLVVVDKGSNQSIENGSYLYPFKTIQKAIDSIAPNSNIRPPKRDIQKGRI